MELLIYLLAFITAVLVILIIYEVLYDRKLTVKERLDTVRDMSDDNEKDDEWKAPFVYRIIQPVYQKLIKAIGKVTPSGLKRKYDHLILTSGSSQKTNFHGLLLKQILMGTAHGILLYIVLKYTSNAINIGRIFLFALVGFSLPLISLYSKAEKRKEKMKRSLPDLLDLLYVSVEAGLGFDAAFKKTSDKMQGPLSFEVTRTMNEITRGKEREEALRDLAYRTGVEEVLSFVTAIIQTEKLGSSITNMLKTQSVTMRQIRRQRAEEKAAKLPIKMLFPLVFLMFPSLFVVILGPAVINIFENLMSR